MNQHSYADSKPDINVTVAERAISVLAGAFLLIRALKKRNLGILNGSAAGFLLYRGFSGHCPGYTAMGKKTLHNENQPASAPIADPVEDAGIVNKITTP